MLSGKVINGLDVLFIQFQVVYSFAISADHMVMKIGSAVKAVAAVGSRDLDGFPFICKQIQITVYRTEADVRKCFSYMKIHRISSGMLCGMT